MMTLPMNTVCNGIRAFTTLILGLTLLAACTQEDSPRRPHSAAVTESSPILAKPTAQEILEIKQTSTEFSVQFKARLDLLKLENEKRAQSPEERGSLYSMVRRAGETVLALEPADASRDSILQTFQFAVTAGCDDQLRGCRFTQFFKATPGTTEMLLILADNSMPNLGLRYRFLALAFALTGQVNDPRISVAYILTGPAYEAELNAKTDQPSREALEQHREIFEASFARLKQSAAAGEKISPEIIATLSQSFDIWNLDRPRRVETADRENALFGIVAGQMFDDPSLMTRLMAETAARSDSAMARLPKIEPKALDALGVQNSLKRNINSFISENLWLGRISLEEAQAIWTAYLRSRSANTGDFREVAQAELLNYARTRLLLTAMDVNQITTNFFNGKSDALTARFSTGDAFRRWQLETVKGQIMWADAIHRMESLRSFNDRNLRTVQATDKTSRDLDLFFASLDRNIKLISTYPSMLVTVYHLAKLKFVIKYDSMSGPKSYEAGTILDQFFDGYFEPFMAYSDDRARLSKPEITMVFYYALELATLSNGGVDIAHLFKMLTEQMAGKTRVQAEKLGDDFRKAYEENRFSVEFASLCAQLDKSNTPEAQKQNSLRISAPIPLTSLKNYVLLGRPEFMGTKDFAHPILTGGWGVFIGDGDLTKNKFGENLEMIRLDFTTRIDRIKTLATVVDDQLQRHNDNSRDLTMSAIKKEVAPLEALRTRLYTQIFKLVNMNGACGETMTKLELEAQLHVMRGLTAHFRDVHAAIKNARDVRIDPEVYDGRFGFAKSGKILDLANYERALGVTSGFYRVSRLQILLRIATILQEGYVDGKRVVEGIRAKNSIQLPARLRDVEPDWKQTNLRIDWNDDVDEFITNGIMQVFDPTSGFIRWSSLSTLASSIQARIEGMATLAKAGIVQTASGPQRVEPKEILRMSLVMEKWLEVEGTEWANILSVTGEYTRVKTSGFLDEFAWETKSRTWMGTLDFAFMKITDDKLDPGVIDNFTKGDVARRIGPKRSYVEYAQAIRAFGEPALKISESVKTIIDEFYKSRIDRQFELSAETIQAIKKLEPARAANPASFPSWRLYASRPSPVVPLLSESRLENFRLDTVELTKTIGYRPPTALEEAFKR